MFRQHDRSGTGAEGRPGVNEIFQLLEEEWGQQFQKRSRFASRDHQAVDRVEVFGFADEDNISAEFFESAAVGVEVALEGENTDSKTAIRHSLFAGGAVSFRLSAISKTNDI
jgi:hypothetical protein